MTESSFALAHIPQPEAVSRIVLLWFRLGKPKAVSHASVGELHRLVTLLDRKPFTSIEHEGPDLKIVSASKSLSIRAPIFTLLPFAIDKMARAAHDSQADTRKCETETE